MLGPYLAWVLCLWCALGTSFICLPRSTFSCQSHTGDNSPVGTFCCNLSFSPALINAMFGLSGSWYLLCWIPAQMTSATALSIWSWHHLYLPSPRAFEQQLKMCASCRAQWICRCFCQPPSSKFDGVGRTSYTDWIRNLSLPGSDFQNSDQVIFQLWCQVYLCSTPLALVTLNSSVRSEKVSCRFLVCPYRPIQLSFGRPSYLHRNWLMVRSKPSTIISGTWYINNGHRSLGWVPCWYIHALDILIARFSALHALTGSLLCLSDWHWRSFPGSSQTSLTSMELRVHLNGSNACPPLSPFSIWLAWMSFSLMSQQHPDTDVSVTIRSSLKARICGWQMPDLAFYIPLLLRWQA